MHQILFRLGLRPRRWGAYIGFKEHTPKGRRGKAKGAEGKEGIGSGGERKGGRE